MLSYFFFLVKSAEGKYVIHHYIEVNHPGLNLCLIYVLSFQNTQVHQYFWFWYWRSNPGPHACWTSILPLAYKLYPCFSLFKILRWGFTGLSELALNLLYSSNRPSQSFSQPFKSLSPALVIVVIEILAGVQNILICFITICLKGLLHILWCLLIISCTH